MHHGCLPCLTHMTSSPSLVLAVQESSDCQWKKRRIFIVDPVTTVPLDDALFLCYLCTNLGAPLHGSLKGLEGALGILARALVVDAISP